MAPVLHWHCDAVELPPGERPAQRRAAACHHDAVAMRLLASSSLAMQAGLRRKFLGEGRALA